LQVSSFYILSFLDISHVYPYLLLRKLTISTIGSVAAGVQSGIGSVVAPSIFSVLQSAAAGGYGLATVLPAVQVAGGAILSSVAAVASQFQGGVR
jgi:hypothetical protein